MAYIAAHSMTDDVLISYNDMMDECVVKIQNFSLLAVNIWSDVLKELDRRGRVKLISGSYDDVGNALIQRLY